jgi:hypothetical protein
MKKYKLIKTKYTKICEQSRCLKIAKPGDIYCYNFLNQGICSKDTAGEDRVLTEVEEKAEIILQRNRKRELQKYKKCPNEKLVKVCMKENCLSIVDDGVIYCKLFINSGICEHTIIDNGITLTELEKSSGIELRKKITTGELKTYIF